MEDILRHTDLWAFDVKNFSEEMASHRNEILQGQKETALSIVTFALAQILMHRPQDDSLNNCSLKADEGLQSIFARCSDASTLYDKMTNSEANDRPGIVSFQKLWLNIIRAFIIGCSKAYFKQQCCLHLCGLCIHFAKECAQSALLPLVKGEFGEDKIDVPTRLPFSPINEAILHTASSHHPHVVTCCTLLIRSWLTAIKNSSSTNEMPSIRNAFVADLVTRSCAKCMSTLSSERLAGVRIIHELASLFPPGWCILMEVTILESLLFSLQQLAKELASVVAIDIINTLKKIVVSCHSPTSTGKSMSSPKSYRSSSSSSGTSNISVSLSSLLASTISSSNSLLRFAGIVLVETLSSSLACTTSELLQNITSRAQKEWLSLLESDANILPEETYGYLSCISYLNTLGALTFKPSLAGSAQLLKIVTKVLELANAQNAPPDKMQSVRLNSKHQYGSTKESFGEEIFLQFSCFPFDVPVEVVSKLSCIRFVGSLFKNEHIAFLFLHIDSHEVFNACLKFLFSSLSSSWNEIILESQLALEAVLKKMKEAGDFSLLKDMAEEVFKSYAPLWTDERNFSNSFLVGFKALLSLDVTQVDCPFYGNMLLEKLKSSVVAESISVVSEGPQLETAVQILRVFGILPFQKCEAAVQAEFVEKLIHALVTLEKSRFDFFSPEPHISPLVEPVAVFLLRCKEVALDFFLTHANMAKPHIFTALELLIDSKNIAAAEFSSSCLLSAKGVQGLVDILSVGSSTNAGEPKAKRPRIKELATTESAASASSEFLDSSEIDCNLTEGVENCIRVVSMLMLGPAPHLLHHNRDLLASLRSLWSRSLAWPQFDDAVASHQFDRECKRSIALKLLSEVLMMHCNMHPERPVLFELSHAMCVNPLYADLYFVDFFFQSELPMKCDARQVKDFLVAFLNLLPDFALSLQWKAKMLQNFIVPLLLYICVVHEKKSGVVRVFDEEVAGLVAENILISSKALDATESSISSSLFPHEGNSTKWRNQLSVELLKFTTFILEHASTQFTKHSKELYAFGHNSYFINSEDVTTTFWAYINIARSIAAQHFQPKVILHVYNKLLRSFTEGKDLVKHALDILVPMLPVRLLPEELSKAMNWTKRLLYNNKDANSTLQFVHVWQCLVRHPDVFFPFREQLVPQTIPSLGRLVQQQQSSTTDYRIVCVSIIECIVQWEIKGGAQISDRIDLSTTSNPSEVAMQVDEISPDGFLLSASQTSVLFSILIKLGVLFSESKETTVSQLAPRCVDLLGKLMSFKSMQTVKVSHFERSLQGTIESYGNAQKQYQRDIIAHQQSNSNAPKRPNQPANQPPKPPMIAEMTLITYLDTLIASLDAKDGAAMLLLPNLVLIACLFRLIFTNEGAAVQSLFRKFISRVVQLFPVSRPPSQFYASSFYRKLKDEIENNLKSANLFAASIPNSSEPKILPAVLFSLEMIQDMCQQSPAWVDNHGSSLLRVSQKLMAEHVNRSFKTSRNDYLAYGNVGNFLEEIDPNFAQLQLTPSLSILAEKCTSSNGQAKVYVAQAGVGDHLLELALAMHLMLQGIENGFLEQFKEAIIGLASSVLESANSPVVSNVVADYCLRWIGTETGPLSSREQSNLFSKIITFFDRLPERFAITFNIRIALLSERLGDLYALRGDAFRGAFGETFSHLPTSIKIGALGLMSPQRLLRERSQQRVFSSWGDTPVTRLIGLLAAEVPYFANRFWPSIITSLFLSCAQSADVKCFDQATIALPDPSDLPKQGHDPEFDSTYKKFVDLVSSVGGEQSSKLLFLSNLSELSLLHVEVGNSLWQQYLQQLWTSMDQVNRDLLTMAFADNLVRNRNKKRFVSNSELPDTQNNVPQALLLAFSQLVPKPILPIEIVSAIGSEYNAWYEALELLEREDAQVDVSGSSVDAEASRSTLFNSTLSANLRLLAELEDRDLSLAHLRLYSSQPETNLAASLESFGHFAKAQELLVQLIKDQQFPAQPDSERQMVMSKALEIQQWENRWVECSKELSQWTAIANYARNLRLVDLAIDSAIIRCDWEMLKEIRESPALYSQVERGVTITKSKLVDVVLSMVDMRQQDIDRHCLTAVHTALSQWDSRVLSFRGSAFHKTMLHVYHRIIELREGSSMIIEASKMSREAPYDFSKISTNWKCRLPETAFDDLVFGTDFEDRMPSRLVGYAGVNAWETLTQWRSFVCQKVDQEVQSKFEGFKFDVPRRRELVDSPWAMLGLAKVASKHSSSRSLASARRPNYSRAPLADGASDEFMTLREEIMLCLSPARSIESIGLGLQIIQRANFAALDSEQKSELLRIRGVCQSKLNLLNEAQESFSQSVQACDSFARGWSSWGQFCLDMYNSDCVVSKYELASASLVCILKACECDPFSASLMLHKAMWIVESSDDTENKLSNLLLEQSANIPSWVWLPLLPTLMSCLKRKKSVHVLPILARISLIFPQAVLLHAISLRSESSVSKDLEAICTEIIDTQHNNILFLRMNKFTSEISRHLAPDGLSTIVAKLREALNTLANDFSVRFTDPVPDAIVQELIEVLVKGQTLGAANILGAKLWSCLEEDLGGKKSSGKGKNAANATLRWHFLGKIKAWLQLLEQLACSDEFSGGCSMEANFAVNFSSCPLLWSQVEDCLDVPGQYLLVSGEPRRDTSFVKIIRAIPMRPTSAQRKRVCLLGSDGQKYTFGAMHGNSGSSEVNIIYNTRLTFLPPSSLSP